MRTVFMILVLFFSKNVSVNGSENRANLDSLKIKSQNVTAVFWNVENLYDPYDDSTILDDDFTSSGARRWTYSRFSLKLNHLAKTLLSAGGWEAPALIGLCEIENRYVLNKLVYETPLKTWKYRFVHNESPDRRGVDVALLYRPDRFRVLSSRAIPIRFPFDTLARTRDILCVKGILDFSDTLVLFVNHWPSRRGGYSSSQPRRNHVAVTLRRAADSVLTASPASNILMMGDFNDEPQDQSLQDSLGASNDTAGFSSSGLYNLMGIRNKSRPEGTLKFRDQWSTFDQFIVSGNLMNGLSGLKAGTGQVSVFKPSFLVEEDAAYFGKKLNRTYVGPRYHGGFSDHLPVRIRILQVDKTGRPR